MMMVDVQVLHVTWEVNTMDGLLYHTTNYQTQT